MEQKKIIVGATGASGLPLLLECLKLIRAAEGFSSALMMTHGAELTLKHEMAMERADAAELADEIFAIDEIGAGPASGSYRAVGMLVVPCSMKTAGAIAHGVTDDLLTRAADVTLKEGRRLLLVPRETPMHEIHLENLLRLARAGAVIMPAAPGFYHRPETLDDLVNMMVGKILDRLGIEAELFTRWR